MVEPYKEFVLAAVQAEPIDFDVSVSTRRSCDLPTSAGISLRVPTSIHKILGFGASSMHGVGDSQGGFLKRLGSALHDRGHRTEVVNLGIRGNTTRDMLKRGSAAEVHKPYFSIVLLGSNDLPRANDRRPEVRVGLDEYRENLQEIFAAIRNERNLFITSFFPDQTKVGITLQTFKDYMTAATETAEGFEVWDLFTESLSFGSQYWAADGVHYNDAGHEYICNALMQKLGIGRPL